jgi:hypothetical protein
MLGGRWTVSTNSAAPKAWNRGCARWVLARRGRARAALTNVTPHRADLGRGATQRTRATFQGCCRTTITDSSDPLAATAILDTLDVLPVGGSWRRSPHRVRSSLAGRHNQQSQAVTSVDIGAGDHKGASDTCSYAAISGPSQHLDRVAARAVSKICHYSRQRREHSLSNFDE